MADHQGAEALREHVNRLRDIAIRYLDAEQLRERIAYEVESWNRRPAPADQERAERLIEVLRIERDTARAQKDHLVKLLTSIHALLYPRPITTPEGRTYVFQLPADDAQRFMRDISQRIHEIPEKLAEVAPAAGADGLPKGWRPAPASDLRAAAQAVVDRWDSPQWKDEPHTAEFINRLRRALEAVGGGEDHGSKEQ